jgi:hypothetical protein
MSHFCPNQERHLKPSKAFPMKSSPYLHRANLQSMKRRYAIPLHTD